MPGRPAKVDAAHIVFIVGNHNHNEAGFCGVDLPSRARRALGKFSDRGYLSSAIRCSDRLMQIRELYLIDGLVYELTLKSELTIHTQARRGIAWLMVAKPANVR